MTIHPVRQHIHGPRHRVPGDPEGLIEGDSWAWLVEMWSRRVVEPDESATSMYRRPFVYTTSQEHLAGSLAMVLDELTNNRRPVAMTLVTEHIRAALVLMEAETARGREAPNWHEWVMTRDRWTHARALIDLWTRTAGVELCLSILTHPPVLAREFLGHDDHRENVELVLPEDGGFRLDTGHRWNVNPMWWALREWVSQSSEQEFLQAREVAARMAASASHDLLTLNLRSRIAYAFSRDPSIGQQVAEDIRRHGLPVPDIDRWYMLEDCWVIEYLLPSLPDATSVLALIKSLDDLGWRPPTPAAFSFDIADAYGADAVPILDAILDTPYAHHMVCARAARDYAVSLGSYGTATR